MKERDELEKRVIDLHQDKERLLYWLCRAYQQPDPTGGPTPFRVELAKVLEWFGYGAERVKRMVELGEPSPRRPSKTFDAETLARLRTRIGFVLDILDEISVEG